MDDLQLQKEQKAAEGPLTLSVSPVHSKSSSGIKHENTTQEQYLNDNLFFVYCGKNMSPRSQQVTLKHWERLGCKRLRPHMLKLIKRRF